ncbi:MAG TPA: MFS transporter [bacterium]|nr:MFS transporter [bacterium]
MGATTGSRPRVRGVRIRYLILGLISLMYFITYIDRTNISVAAPVIEKSLHFSKIQMGLIFSAFAYPYGFLQIFGGWFGDVLGPRLGLVLIGLVWSAATLITGGCRTLGQFLGARFLLGLGEAGAFPTATRAFATWMPPEERGLAQGIPHSFARLGGAAAPPLVVGITLALGWQASFYALGAVSLVWVLVFLAYFRNEPRTHPAVTASELAEIGERTKSTDRRRIPWGQLAARIWPVTLVDFCYGWCLWVYLTWLPSYLVQARHFSFKSMALYASLPLLAGVVGDTLGGLITDALLRRTGNLRFARTSIIIAGLLAAGGLIFPAAYGASAVGAVVFLSASFFCLELTNSSLWALPMDIAPEFAGTAGGMMNTGFGIAGTVAPLVFGWLIQSTHNWQVPFAVTAALLLVGAVAAFAINPVRGVKIEAAPVPSAAPA